MFRDTYINPLSAIRARVISAIMAFYDINPASHQSLIRIIIDVSASFVTGFALLRMRKDIGLICVLTLTACTHGASHLPLPHQLPGAAVGSAIDNASYKARRNKVKAAIQPHVDFIMADAARGGGPTFDMTCRVANVSPGKCAELLGQIAQDDHIYQVGTFSERLEKLTVAFMVYGD